jgi:hypothetical protein
MPITVEEKYLSRPAKDSGLSVDAPATTDIEALELHYVVRGTDDHAAAVAAVRSTAPLLAGELERGEIALEPIGPTQWDATVQYALPTIPEDESQYTFDMTGGQQHITASIQTVHKYGRGYTPTGYGGAIGVKADSVEGVDVTVPVYKFSQTHQIDNARVTDGYKGSLFRLTGKVNDAAWGGFAAGEVLFLGPSGSRRGRKGKWEITFNFAASPNETDLTIGEITGIAKKGWEYLWVEFVQELVGPAGHQRMAWVPDAVFIEQVYKTGSFADLEPPAP